jgi:RNA polymerase sigma-70 factor (ECF subfamily)
MAAKESADLLRLLAQPKTRAKAFSEVVLLYQERLYWHIRKMVLSHDDAHDVLQNTFMKAWRGLDNFRGDAQLSTWLYKIATNETMTFLSALLLQMEFKGLVKCLPGNVYKAVLPD